MILLQQGILTAVVFKAEVVIPTDYGVPIPTWSSSLSRRLDCGLAQWQKGWESGLRTRVEGWVGPSRGCCQSPQRVDTACVGGDDWDNADGLIPCLGGEMADTWHPCLVLPCSSSSISFHHSQQIFKNGFSRGGLSNHVLPTDTEHHCQCFSS